MKIEVQYVGTVGNFVEIEVDEVTEMLTSKESIVEFAQHLRDVADELILGVGQ